MALPSAYGHSGARTKYAKQDHDKPKPIHHQMHGLGFVMVLLGILGAKQDHDKPKPIHHQMHDDPR